MKFGEIKNENFCGYTVTINFKEIILRNSKCSVTTDKK